MAPVISGSNSPAIFWPSEYAVDPVTPLVSTRVIGQGILALLLTGGTGTYPFVAQRLSKAIGVVASVADQPTDIRQIAEQRSCADVVADLSDGDDEAR